MYAGNMHYALVAAVDDGTGQDSSAFMASKILQIRAIVGSLP